MRESDEETDAAATTPHSGSADHRASWCGRSAAPPARRVGMAGSVGPAGFTPLHQLPGRGSRRSGELADAVRAEPSTVSQRVAVLVREGPPRGEPDPADRRACPLAVTGNGEAVLQERCRNRRRLLDQVLVGGAAADGEALTSQPTRPNTVCAERLPTRPTELADERAGPLRGSE